MPTLLRLFILRRVRDSFVVILDLVENKHQLSEQERAKLAKGQEIGGYVNIFLTLFGLLLNIVFLLLFFLCAGALLGVNPLMLPVAKCLEVVVMLVCVHLLNCVIGSNKELILEEDMLHEEIDNLATKIESI